MLRCLKPRCGQSMSHGQRARACRELSVGVGRLGGSDSRLHYHHCSSGIKESLLGQTGPVCFSLPNPKTLQFGQTTLAVFCIFAGKNWRKKKPTKAQSPDRAGIPVTACHCHNHLWRDPFPHCSSDDNSSDKTIGVPPVAQRPKL